MLWLGNAQMTLVVSIKVNDGLVLAADSASTMVRTHANGQQEVCNVYNNADKVFNLVRRGSVCYPIGAVTFGAGSIGPASISTLVKDFRKIIADASHPLYVDPGNYTVLGVATKFRQFMLEDKYNSVFGSQAGKPDLGFIIGGYSSNADVAEDYALVALGGQFLGPDIYPTIDGSSINYFGQPEAVERLLYGVSLGLPDFFINNLSTSSADAYTLHRSLKQTLEVRLVDAAMPIQDAIDLAEFLVDLTAKFIRFQEGAQTVGGPIEIATITKHEDFKWVKRKHFYKRELQPI